MAAAVYQFRMHRPNTIKPAVPPQIIPQTVPMKAMSRANSERPITLATAALKIPKKMLINAKAAAEKNRDTTVRPVDSRK